MKKFFSVSICVAFLNVACVSNASAQGFFKKLEKGVGKAVKTAEKVSDAASDSKVAAGADSLSAKLPSYRFVKMKETDAEGNVINNEDGTPRYLLRVYDRDNRVTDPETARRNIKSLLNSNIGQAAVKVAMTTAVGIIGGKSVKGALAGAAAGLGMSVDNFIVIFKQVKELKAFDKKLDVYQKNFNDEGLPIDATMDTSKLKDLDMKNIEEVTRAQSEVAEELANSKKVSSEDIDWDQALNGK